ncbi:unnamed protein product, partial [Closterium sp. Naga37s-1]
LSGGAQTHLSSPNNQQQPHRTAKRPPDVAVPHKEEPMGAAESMCMVQHTAEQAAPKLLSAMPPRGCCGPARDQAAAAESDSGGIPQKGTVQPCCSKGRSISSDGEDLFQVVTAAQLVQNTCAEAVASAGWKERACKKRRTERGAGRWGFRGVSRTLLPVLAVGLVTCASLTFCQAHSLPSTASAASTAGAAAVTHVRQCLSARDVLLVMSCFVCSLLQRHSEIIVMVAALMVVSLSHLVF